MPSEYLYFKGKGSWIRATTTNEWKKWSMQLHPDQESLEKIRELQGQGVKNTISKDDDGWFIRLSRPSEIKVKGALKGMLPPQVWDGTRPLPDGSGFMPWDHSKIIGNGSDVLVRVEVYQHRIPNAPGKMAKAMRWDSIRIDNPVPFEAKKDLMQEQQDQNKEFSEQPKQLW